MILKGVWKGVEGCFKGFWRMLSGVWRVFEKINRGMKSVIPPPPRLWNNFRKYLILPYLTPINFAAFPCSLMSVPWLQKCTFCYEHWPISRLLPRRHNSLSSRQCHRKYSKKYFKEQFKNTPRIFKEKELNYNHNHIHQ